MISPTPGPWATVTLGHQQNRQTQVRDEAGEIVIAVLPTRSHTEANARLIAAAPDLLAALKTLVGSLEWEKNRSGTTYVGFEDAVTALAKAKGRDA